MSTSPTNICPLIASNFDDKKKPVPGQWGHLWGIIKTLIIPYWFSQEKTSARILLFTVLSLNLLYVYIFVLLNKWNGQFFDALQRLDHSKFNSLLYMFVFYVACVIGTLLVKEYLQNYLCFRWRSWMTHVYLSKWFNQKAFYKSLHPEPKIDNPDQRISQDINSFAFSTMQLCMSTVTSAANGAAFAIILWSLSPPLTLSLGGSDYLFPGYMLWLAIAYAFLACYSVFKIGKPLIKLDFIQEKAEANFRFGLMRIVDRKEEVALLNAEKDDLQTLHKQFQDIRSNYKKILLRQIYISSTQNIFFNALTVCPLLAAAPMFFAGAITLGIMMQLSGAFSAVSHALLIFVQNYQLLASWKATSNRLEQFLTHTDLATIPQTSPTLNENVLQVKNLEIFKGHETPALYKIDFSLKLGEKILLQGKSGRGKTTLVKAIAGIWPYVKGEVIRPETLHIVPQKPYFPIATLREVIFYGNEQKIHPEALILQRLNDFDLAHLAESLDTHGDWNTKLSLGEQQRVNFVRIALMRPRWLILDEPTASLDLKNQQNAMEKLFMLLKESTILTISHSSELESMHDRLILIN